MHAVEIANRERRRAVIPALAEISYGCFLPDLTRFATKQCGRPAVERYRDPARDGVIIGEARASSKRAPSCAVNRHLSRQLYFARGEPSAGVLIRRIQQCCIAGVLAVVACGPSPTPPSPATNELVVLLRQGPATWFVGPDAQSTGFDYDLLRLFAQRHNLVLKVVAASNPGAKLGGGNTSASLAAGGLYKPADAIGTAADAGLLYSTGYYAVDPVLICHADSFRPASWADLAGSTVAIVEGTGLAVALAKVRAAHPEIEWRPLAVASTEALIRQVSDGAIDYAIVASNDAEAARNVYLNFERALPSRTSRSWYGHSHPHSRYCAIASMPFSQN